MAVIPAHVQHDVRLRHTSAMDWAAAWLCQITVNILVFFMPFVNVL